MLDLLSRDHQELERLLAVAQALVGSDAPPPQADFERQRWRFDRWLTRHIHTLRWDVYPALRGRGRHGEAALLAELTASTEALLARYEAHKARFTPAEIAPQWPAYLSSARKLLAEIDALIEAQRRDLYPILRRLEDG